MPYSLRDQQLLAVGFELQYETVLVAQPADVKLIFEGGVIVFHSESLCDFHWEVVMDTECPDSQITSFPVVVTVIT